MIQDYAQLSMEPYIMEKILLLCVLKLVHRRIWLKMLLSITGDKTQQDCVVLIAYQQVERSQAINGIKHVLV